MGLRCQRDCLQTSAPAGPPDVCSVFGWSQGGLCICWHGRREALICRAVPLRGFAADVQAETSLAGTSASACIQQCQEKVSVGCGNPPRRPARLSRPFCSETVQVAGSQKQVPHLSLQGRP